MAAADEHYARPVEWWWGTITTRVWESVPTVHLEDIYAGRYPDAMGPFTRCGINRQTYSAAQLPIRHAVKIGRPCKRCFPNGFPEVS